MDTEPDYKITPSSWKQNQHIENRFETIGREGLPEHSTDPNLVSTSRHTSSSVTFVRPAQNLEASMEGDDLTEEPLARSPEANIGAESGASTASGQDQDKPAPPAEPTKASGPRWMVSNAFRASRGKLFWSKGAAGQQNSPKNQDGTSALPHPSAPVVPETGEEAAPTRSLIHSIWSMILWFKGLSDKWFFFVLFITMVLAVGTIGAYLSYLGAVTLFIWCHKWWRGVRQPLS